MLVPGAGTQAPSTSGAQHFASFHLHLIDVNMAIGNLIEIVRVQGKAFLAVAGKSQP